MVLQLSTICLRSLRDAIEKGKIRHFHLQSLPPILRQILLDLILMYDKIEHPISSDLSTNKYSICAYFSRKCQQCRVEPTKKASVATPEFIQGMQSFSTLAGYSNDHIFLNRVSDVMATILPTGATIGHGISELGLKVYGYYSSGRRLRAYGMSIQSVIRLISQCPRLESLQIRLDAYSVDSETYYVNREENSTNTSSNKIFCSDTVFAVGIMNRFDALDPCLPIMENLTQLSLVGRSTYPAWGTMLTAQSSIIGFKRLQTLRLKDASVNGVAWNLLMYGVRDCLAHLFLKNVQIIGDQNAILPITLPHLKSLTVKNPKLICTPLFVENLSKCQELEYVFFLVANECYREESLSDLAKIDSCKMEIGLYLDFEWAKRAFSDESRITAVIDLFSNKIRKCFLEIISGWNRNFITTLDHLIRTCHYLTDLGFRLPVDYEDDRLMREVREASLVLLPLFRDKERASRLLKLKFSGAFDDEVSRRLFENCLNLSSLVFVNCLDLADYHLIEWANRGGKLSKIELEGCNNVGDEGLIPIIINSCEKLTRFATNLWNANPKVTERTWQLLGQNCPYLKRVKGVPEDMEDTVRSKCFNSAVEISLLDE